MMPERRNPRTQAGGPASSSRQAAVEVNSSNTQGQPLVAVLERLQKVRRSGKGHVAKCPAHDDRFPSLSITEAADGRVLVHCHAGCSAERVVSALGLRLRDLFPDDRPRPGFAPRRAQPLPRRLAEGLMERKAFPFEWEVAKILARVPELLAQRDVLASWDYLEAGDVDIPLVVALSRYIREVEAA